MYGKLLNKSIISLNIEYPMFNDINVPIEEQAVTYKIFLEFYHKNDYIRTVLDSTKNIEIEYCHIDNLKYDSLYPAKTKYVFGSTEEALDISSIEIKGMVYKSLCKVAENNSVNPRTKSIFFDGFTTRDYMHYYLYLDVLDDYNKLVVNQNNKSFLLLGDNELETNFYENNVIVLFDEDRKPFKAIIVSRSHYNAKNNENAEIEVSVPDISVEFDGSFFENINERVPLIKYNDILYMPLNTNMISASGMSSIWDHDKGLMLFKHSYIKKYASLDSPITNSAYKKAKLLSFPISIDGMYIDQSNTEFPFLMIDYIAYMPMTPEFMLDGFDLYTRWQNKNNLEIGKTSSLSSKTITLEFSKEDINNTGYFHDDMLYITETSAESEISIYLDTTNLLEFFTGKIADVWVESYDKTGIKLSTNRLLYNKEIKYDEMYNYNNIAHHIKWQETSDKASTYKIFIKLYPQYIYSSRYKAYLDDVSLEYVKEYDYNQLVESGGEYVLFESLYEPQTTQLPSEIKRYLLDKIQSTDYFDFVRSNIVLNGIDKNHTGLYGINSLSSIEKSDGKLVLLKGSNHIDSYNDKRVMIIFDENYRPFKIIMKSNY